MASLSIFSEFNLTILRHSGILGAADDAALKDFNKNFAAKN